MPVYTFPTETGTSESISRDNQQIKSQRAAFTGNVSYEHFQRKSDGAQFFLGNNVSDQVAVDLSMLWQQRYPFQVGFKYSESSPFQLEDRWQFSFGFDERQYT